MVLTATSSAFKTTIAIVVKVWTILPLIAPSRLVPEDAALLIISAHIDVLLVLLGLGIVLFLLLALFLLSFRLLLLLLLVPLLFLRGRRRRSGGRS